MKVKKALIAGISVAVSACLAFGATGCGFIPEMSPLMSLDEFSDLLALSLLGDSPISWNILSVDPENSFGVQTGDAQWYSYSATTQNDIKQTRSVFKQLRTELKKYNPARLNAKEAVTYRSLEYALDTYYSYYNSPYALEFDLIGGGYIDSFGGYVADFATTFENYVFRSNDDIDDLLDLTESTRTAFNSYLDYANDRADNGFPLYDYAIVGMQDYLDGISEQGSEYYLYAVAQNKIDDAGFLSSAQKTRYKTEFATALDGSFMAGVRELSSGLNEYKGNVVTVQESYLAAYGDAGVAYYKWMFENKTGIGNANILGLYDEMLTMYSDYSERMNEITEYIESIEQSDPELYNTFNAYVGGESALLGLTEPTEMLEYLKVAAKSIVPDLKSTPEIDFKYMDRTAGEISNQLAYYIKSPVDDLESAEHITLNPYVESQGGAAELLTTIAHEGYPGHLYAYVNAKENGADLLSSLQNCMSFAEGWANYVEVAVLEYIADNTDDVATKLYCEYAECEMVVGYLNMVMIDIQVNYLGFSVADFVNRDIAEETAVYIIESFFEMPTVYVPYGYGFYIMLDLHDKAKTSLGDKYSEVDFNGYMLSEGFAPTIPRAKELAAEFITENR